ncbi:MAG: hypothetical protein S4CHLAM102_10500 [Chlamydiia bacterium]|nr:hypothetical protein [Chlamydiia bacterium]
MMQTLLFPLLFLITSALLTAIKTAMRRMSDQALKDELHAYRRYYSVYILLYRIFPENYKEVTLQSYLNLTTQITRLGFGISTTLFLISEGFGKFGLVVHDNHMHIKASWFFLSLCIIVFIGILLDVIFRFFSSRLPIATLKLFSWYTQLIILLFLPITLTILAIQKLISPRTQADTIGSHQTTVHKRLSELLQEEEMDKALDRADKLLLLSFAKFKERIVKEILIPRKAIAAVPNDATIMEGVVQVIEEGFTRLPVYKNSLDEMIGVVHAKNFLQFFTENMDHPEKLHSTKVEEIMNPILYIPETKSVSRQLQEFRVKREHIAIVVDEYGGTEGLLTLEDILEEIVGEIRDEYDADEEHPYRKTSDNAWTVDASMSLVDIEKELGIIIPPSSTYDCIGGFIYAKASCVPDKGWKIVQEDFEVEVLTSTPRQVKTVSIRKTTPIQEK